jgi:hypothetical protein
MSYGTAALARGSVPASGSHANGGHADGAPPAMRVRGVRRSFDAEAAPARALRGLKPRRRRRRVRGADGPSGQTIVVVTYAAEVAASACRIVRMRTGRAEGQP